MSIDCPVYPGGRVDQSDPKQIETMWKSLEQWDPDDIFQQIVDRACIA
ncbi:MAG TPA: hypothetical protein VGQ36_16370 [Thermoanaerobaculia bacterium]|jgi:hypothetical protein|nr:hypothetical protein [Thermoanaerobaculia bacterium]